MILKELYRKYRFNKNQKRRNKYWNDEFRKNTNSYVLNDEQKEAIQKKYSKYVKVNDIYHNFYLEKTGIFDENIIPDNIYYNYIDQFYNNWDSSYIMDNKCYYDLFFSNVKQPETILKRINNLWFNKEKDIVSIENVFSILQNESAFFIKEATNSEGGHGVSYVEKYDYDKINQILTKIKGDLIIQKGIKQSKELSKLNSSSVNTIRCLTLLRNGSVKMYSSVVRMGINGAKVDNASSGGITCGIKENGQLKDVAYSAAGKRYTEHPTSKVKFGDIIIPNYNKIVEFVKNEARILPYYRLVSWDIALDENNQILLIEANLKYGELDFHQLNNGPVFGSDTDEILEEVFEGKK